MPPSESARRHRHAGSQHHSLVRRVTSAPTVVAATAVVLVLSGVGLTALAVTRGDGSAVTTQGTTSTGSTSTGSTSTGSTSTGSASTGSTSTGSAGPDLAAGGVRAAQAAAAPTTTAGPGAGSSTPPSAAAGAPGRTSAAPTGAGPARKSAARPAGKPAAAPAEAAPAGTPVSRFGALHVCGSRLCAADGTAVQLRGVSSMWLNWEDDGYAESLATLRFMRDSWGISVIRAAMGVEPDGAYLTNPTRAIAQVEKIIANATSAGVYVIVDYHAHEADRNRSAAVSFFRKLAAKYGDRPNVLWETFNEPLEVSWTGVLKPYHQAVLTAIRAEDPDNVVILGTRTWSQRVDDAAASPVRGENLMYTLHFYSCTHTTELRATAQAAVRAGLPLFITEWGASHADGGLDGRVCEAEAGRWLDFAKANKISWTAWKLDDCADTTCLLTEGTAVSDDWDRRLHGHAGFVVKRLKSG